MVELYEAEIAEVVTSLNDELTGQVERGGHSTVYFGKYYVYKVTEKKVMEKSERVHSIISTSDSKALKGLVPKTVLNKALEKNSLVIEELRRGNHPEKIDGKLLKEIITSLSLVHRIEIRQVLTDFEGEELPASQYWINQMELGKKYANKLMSSGMLSESDTELISLCLEHINEICNKKTVVPKLKLIYKDVYPPNILIDEDGGLNAIIDWDSAMSGPIELEYVVLWHRYPELWSNIKPEVLLDKDIFMCAGLVQGLRFWKSFMNDLEYVDAQRIALKRTVDLFKLKDTEWLDTI